MRLLLTTRTIATSLLAIGLVARAAVVAQSTSTLPERLSDAEFWAIRQESSEPGGYFRITDNYTSNEGEIGLIFAALRRSDAQGGVYLGVGPEQNLTYIAAIRPDMAFILDIRRQAAMQHLMFKSIFEVAADRVEFISLLFAKPRPPNLDDTTSIQTIWQAFATVAADSDLAAKTQARILQRLADSHGFSLTADESAEIGSVYQAFVGYGPSISTRGTGGFGGGSNYTFADLTGWSTDETGTVQSFLATEDNFRFVKSLHERNLIIPITGDFGGPKALRAIGNYVRLRGGTVRAFYLSNVEQYLFQDGKASAFYGNVATLPVDESSVFIRPQALRRIATPRPLCPIAAFLGAVSSGQVVSNFDSLTCAGR